MKIKVFGLLLFGILISACHSTPQEVILGAWQVDSVSTYYNGFTYQSGARHWKEMYQYDTSQVVIRKDQDSRRMSYRINHDTLQYLDVQQMPVSKFRILRLDDEQLVLRKDLSPLWKGPEQIRYEIRYFTRVDTASFVSTRLTP